MVSVLMSVYNETEKELRIAVESILDQTYQDLEFIIVLDNPENHLLKGILSEYQRQCDKIVLLNNEKNIGLAESLNKAFLLSKGHYIARMDADDISCRTRIERQVHFMEEHTEYAILGTNRDDIDENGNLIRNDRKVITDYKKIAKILKYGSPLSHPSIMIRREVFQNLGGYRTLRSAQDYDLYLRCLLKKYKITNLNEVLIKYRIRKNSISIQNSFQQMLTGNYLRKLYRRAKNRGECSYAYSNEDFEKFCIKKGLYNHEKVADYMKFRNAIKKRNYKDLILSILNNPEFGAYLFEAVRFFYMLKNDQEIREGAAL